MITTRLLIVSAFFALLSISGCAKKSESTPAAQPAVSTASQPAGSSSSNVSKVISVQRNEGKRVAEFSWTDENGKTVLFSDFSRNNVVLINFWATWCGPCKRELPDLIALHEQYKDKDVRIIGISVDRDGDVLGLVRDFAAQSNLKYPIVIDNGELERVFGGIRGIPTTFFVNKNGEIVKKMIGLQSKETFQAAIIAAGK